jgi:hypothetical protein
MIAAAAAGHMHLIIMAAVEQTAASQRTAQLQSLPYLCLVLCLAQVSHPHSQRAECTPPYTTAATAEQ